MASVFLGKYSLGTFFLSPPWVDDGRLVQKTSYFPHDDGYRYTACSAVDSGARFRSASIFFICAFSHIVPEILRTLYNCLITTNKRVRGIRQSPPLSVLWLSLPEPGGAVARVLPGDCTVVASLLQQLLLHPRRAVGDRQYNLCWWQPGWSLKSSEVLQWPHVQLQDHSCDVERLHSELLGNSFIRTGRLD